ncbi:sugar ABC transporter substrate-binding protein [Pseudonocardia kujensis]|uniref:sugar ABC transporter substrate-binding protein n=1 Tax=Pseudonocardia kujensis TaxID=1128675 RepID=UPI001E38183D|nr:sugar ABC transporter substrate-binding protein [Pseudonocardia kujensis]MCE0763763.1 sugar ABC transporter substrate-binding protein [Pseudonocardia kujensis]
MNSRHGPLRTDLSRRTLLRGAAAGGLALAAGLLTGCATTRRSLPAAAAGVTDNNWKVIDQFYTLSNAYFQGWANGSAQAAAQLALHREQQVDNMSNDKVISVFQQARASNTRAMTSIVADPGITPQVLRANAEAGIPTSVAWNLAPWTTPFDVGGTFYQFLAGNNPVGAERLAGLLFEKMGGTGKLIHISGIPGNSASTTRDVGVDAALARYPGITLVARQPGGFDRGTTTPVIESLLTAHPDVAGIFCQNDDSALAVVNALRSRNKSVPVVGIDAIPEFLEAMQSVPEIAFATWAHHGAWMGGALMVRAYDALSGVKLSPAERMMFTGGFVLDTPAAADGYNTLMYKGDTLPYDFSLMSKALHPNDWDPQTTMKPLEFESYFSLEKPKPAGYTVDPAYAAARDGDEFARVEAEYKDHFRKDPFADIRRQCAAGGVDFA